MTDGGAEGATVESILHTDFLSESVVLAGREGLGRVVDRLNLIENPEGIRFWIGAHDLVLTTGFALAQSTEPLSSFVSAAHSVGVAGIVIHFDEDSTTIDADTRAVADELELPLIAVSESFALDHILARGVRDRARQQVRAMYRSERLRRLLVAKMVAGGGVAELASAAAAELDLAVLMTTSDGRRLATAGSDEEVRALCRSSALDGTGRLKTDSTDGGLGLRTTDEGAIAVCAISANGIDHGRVAAFSRHRQLSTQDLYAVDAAAAVFALAVTRDLALSTIEEKHRANFLRDLLLGRGGEHAHAVAHAQRFGWNIGRPVVVVVIEPAPGDDVTRQAPDRMPLVDRQMMAFSGALAQRDPSAAIAALGTETVIMMGAGPNTVNAIRDIIESVRGDGGGGRQPFAVGISRPCTSVEDIPGIYGQARTALKVGRQIYGTWAVTAFDDLGVFRLLSLVENDDELTSFTKETLHELTEQTVEAQDMRKTLEMLLATNINIAETARNLHFHYNTLRYRVVKLEKILGPFTERPDLRLDLSLALKIMAMRGIDQHM
ncbi:PucR family transcriptional regulator ligand-binding domain-containing protein [Rhodococcus sp. H36-A4]|uniref:PucR family transcriptional regulator n=1 Tax=Rhodococcus sp. H36-A4 TaxID=3004353 RepID=UPI0022AFE9D6|nr:PucR family transcriptional regulator [Rhodococcus sp. H36-A4]MCZ4080023.1 PucR family transcriptional regulator ligand-binding domain-containing protein [Rhodococcus sp. H36-A4]